jgi:hypothetical protein
VHTYTGADTAVTDYRDETPESKCNGNAVHAFYELRGLRFEAIEEYEGVYVCVCVVCSVCVCSVCVVCSV